MPSIPRHTRRLEIMAKAEEVIGRGERAVTRQLAPIETLGANGQDTNRAREPLRMAEEHLAELHATRRRLLDGWAGPEEGGWPSPWDRTRGPPDGSG